VSAKWVKYQPQDHDFTLPKSEAELLRHGISCLKNRKHQASGYASKTAKRILFVMEHENTRVAKAGKP
ncbi:MAG: hypothetical protein JW836_00145, partial [Deltaproteobacteria bacterium]|nr:hypothetical protein [Deltaproteobacteria bacterium]